MSYAGRAKEASTRCRGSDAAAPPDLTELEHGRSLPRCSWTGRVGSRSPDVRVPDQRLTRPQERLAKERRAVERPPTGRWRVGHFGCAMADRRRRYPPADGRLRLTWTRRGPLGGLSPLPWARRHQSRPRTRNASPAASGDGARQGNAGSAAMGEKHRVHLRATAPLVWRRSGGAPASEGAPGIRTEPRSER